MSGKAELKLSDDLIKKALQLDLEAVDLPPSGRIWQRIESGFEETRLSPADRHAFNWSRLAAVAAAFLVLVLGGMGVFQLIELQSPAADTFEAPAGFENGFAMLDADDRVAEKDDFTAAGEDGPGTLTEDDPLPGDDLLRSDIKEDPVSIEQHLPQPDWPLVLADFLMLNQTIILSDREGPQYRGAIYSGNATELMWVKSEAVDEDLNIFIKYLGDYIGLSLKDLREINGHFRLEAEELSGLVWQENGQNQALLVISGDINDQELINLAASVE